MSAEPHAADADAATIATAVRERRASAVSIIEATLARIATGNAILNALTGVCGERARETARRVDAAIARGEPAGPLAGVPFVVKAQTAVAGLTTTAGSRLHVDDPPAARDAVAVARLERAGAVCVGVANMDEFGMGGTTENRHFGATRNPHCPTRSPGGSSGGSAAAVAGGLVPIALGSDALGSVRLPAALCGVYGLRPTRGVVPSEGSLPPVGSITTIGPMARTIADLAACFDAIADVRDVPRSGTRVRAGIANGYFRQDLGREGAAALDCVGRALAGAEVIEFPEAARARAAAALINAAESAEPQCERLRRQPDQFDPLTRDRFLAHALIPAAWYFRAQAFRSWHKSEVLRLLRDIPVLVFPATPCVAPEIGTRTIRIGGADVPTGPALGAYTQPLAALDCPVLAVPIAGEGLPASVQLLAAPGGERLLFATAARLEHAGIVRTAIATIAHG